MVRPVAGTAPASRSIGARLRLLARRIPLPRLVRRWSYVQQRVPRWSGTIAVLSLLAATLAYGTIRGGPPPPSPPS